MQSLKKIITTSIFYLTRPTMAVWKRNTIKVATLAKLYCLG